MFAEACLRTERIRVDVSAVDGSSESTEPVTTLALSESGLFAFGGHLRGNHCRWYGTLHRPVVISAA